MLRTLIFVGALLGGCSSQPSLPLAPAHPASPDGPTGMVVAPRLVETLQLPSQPRASSGHQPAEAPEPAEAATSVPDVPLYMCPMHPGVTSNDPTARCPECGMRINKRITPEDPS